jgi:hypothetical protein
MTPFPDFVIVANALVGAVATKTIYHGCAGRKTAILTQVGCVNKVGG